MHAESVTTRDLRRAQYRPAVIAAMLGIVFGASALAQQPLPKQSADALLHRVDDHYNHLRSMRASYTEHYTGMGMTRTETGTLLLSKPGRMRWQYDKPAGKLFLFDGKFGWFYQPGDPQAQRIPAKQLDDLRTPLRFLLGHTVLEKELEQIAVVPTGNLLRITGEPRGSKQLKQVQLDVTPQGEILLLSVTSANGEATSFEFARMMENVPVRNSDFHFVAPAGVTVVDGAPPL